MVVRLSNPHSLALLTHLDIMLSLTSLTRELQTFWQAVAPADVPTQFAGVSLDAAALSSWYEFWITTADEIPQRVPRDGVFVLIIDVHCFSRESNKRRVFELADVVRRELGQQCLRLVDSESSEADTVSLRLRESTVRDLTRQSDSEPRLPLQHLVISFTARAERTAG